MTTSKKTITLPAVAHNGRAIGQRSGTPPAFSGNRKTRRAIKKVIDARGAEPIVMPVEAVLDGLTAVDLTAVRREIASKRATGEILFRCGQCNSPVQISSSPASSTGDGLGAFFKHRGGTPTGCDWRTPDVMRDVGAGQFDGLQEGEAHWRPKNCLADSIRCDSDFSEPIVDKHFIKIGKGHRKPDVFTSYKGQPIAFELQLARLPVLTVMERTAAYREAGITLVWVTSAHELAALNNQAFRDLYLASGGRILAVDAASYERSEDTSVLHLRELSLEPCIMHPFAIYNRWRSRMVNPAVILMPEGQLHAEGQRAYAAALAEKLQAQAPGLTEKIASTVASGADLNLVAAEWSALAKLVGARDLRQSIQDELPRVLRWLQTVERLNNAKGTDKEVAGKMVAALRARVEQIMTGVEAGSIPNPVPRADHFVSGPKTPSWASKMELVATVGGHRFYASGNVPESAQGNSVATSLDVTRPRTAPSPQMAPARGNAPSDLIAQSFGNNATAQGRSRAADLSGPAVNSNTPRLVDGGVVSPASSGDRANDLFPNTARRPAPMIAQTNLTQPSAVNDQIAALTQDRGAASALASLLAPRAIQAPNIAPRSAGVETMRRANQMATDAERNSTTVAIIPTTAQAQPLKLAASSVGGPPTTRTVATVPFGPAQAGPVSPRDQVGTAPKFSEFEAMFGRAAPTATATAAIEDEFGPAGYSNPNKITDRLPATTGPNAYAPGPDLFGGLDPRLARAAPIPFSGAAAALARAPKTAAPKATKRTITERVPHPDWTAKLATSKCPPV